LKVSSTLVVIETIVLGHGKSINIVIVIRANLVFIRWLIADTIFDFLNFLTHHFVVFDKLHLVMCRLGLEALSRPKPALESRAKPKPS
jgi:hypothetical protein